MSDHKQSERDCTHDETSFSKILSDNSQDALWHQQRLNAERIPETPTLSEVMLRAMPREQEDHCIEGPAGFGQSTSRVLLLSGSAITAEPGIVTPKPCQYGSRLEESEEEHSQEEILSATWDDLSILERLGLNRTEMTEEETESAFSQLALAFRCDQYTLKRRLQAEEHARNVAERNILLELEQGKDKLQTLKALCLDNKRGKILQRLELCLNILAATVERVASAAEVLGAVHQEARLSHAVELMVTHVENLQRRHLRDMAELEEARKLVQRSCRSRQLSDPRDEGEMRQKVVRLSQQHATRRRVSVAVIPNHSQREKERKKIEATRSEKTTLTPPTSLQSCKDERAGSNHGREADDWRLACSQHECPREDVLEHSPLQATVEPTGLSLTGRPVHSQDETDICIHPLWPPRDALYQRRWSRGMKDMTLGESQSLLSKTEQLSDCDEFATDTSVVLSEQCPLAPWLSHCRWILFWIYLMALSCVIILGVLLWCLRGPLFWI